MFAVLLGIILMASGMGMLMSASQAAEKRMGTRLDEFQKVDPTIALGLIFFIVGIFLAVQAAG